MVGVMLSVVTAKLQPGMKLVLPVMHPETPAQVLLKAGYDLTDRAIERLRELHVRKVWVDFPGMEFLEKYVSPEVSGAQREVFSHVADAVGGAQKDASPKLDYGAYTDAVGTLVSEIMGNPKAALFMGDLFEAGDDLLRHSSTVAYLSLLMGVKLEAYLVKQRKHIRPDRAKDVTNLGVGAMLHDVGVTQIDAEARERYFKEGDDRDPAWREHPAAGFRMVRGQVDPTAAAVVLHHHQHVDGSGYAGEDFPVQNGESIHVFARIVAVADRFDRLRCPPNLPPQPAVFALRAMQEPKVRAWFDPEVLDALLKVVPAFAPGSGVVLSDGRPAVVMDPHAEHPCRPTVRVVESLACLDDPAVAPEGEVVDLREHPNTLYIKECDGVSVGALNFELERPEDGEKRAA